LKRILISFPVGRKYRFYWNSDYGVRTGLFDAIGLSSDLPHGAVKRLKYPDVRINAMRAIVWRIKILADITKRYKNNRNKYSEFISNKSILIRLAVKSGLTEFRLASLLLEQFIIYFYASQKYDKIIKEYDVVEVTTMCFHSEAFVYSSAVRQKKHIIFSIDGWDIYPTFWIPKKISFYESWGYFFSAQILLEGISLEKILYRRSPFRVFEVDKFPRDIVIYEASMHTIDKISELEIIKSISLFARKNNYNVRLKCLNESKYADVELDAISVSHIHSDAIYSDHASNISSMDIDVLPYLVPNCALFVSIGLSHGVLEFGVSNVSCAYIVLNRAVYLKGPLSKQLHQSGVELIPWFKGLSQFQIENHLTSALSKKPNLRRLIDYK